MNDNAPRHRWTGTDWFAIGMLVLAVFAIFIQMMVIP